MTDKQKHHQQIVKKLSLCVEIQLCNRWEKLYCLHRVLTKTLFLKQQTVQD
jgi:hypothetical protein